MSRLIPVAPEVLEWLSRASTATISTQLFQRGLRNLFMNGLKPLNPQHCRFVGEAVTLRNIPMREDLDTLDEIAGLADRFASRRTLDARRMLDEFRRSLLARQRRVHKWLVRKPSRGRHIDFHTASSLCTGRCTTSRPSLWCEPML